MKTYLKTLLRAFKKHITRFISIVFIVLVSVGFVSGIGTSTEKLKYSLTDYYKDRNVSDFIVKSKKEEGFSAEQIEKARALHGEKNISTGASVDAYVGVNGEKQLLRLYFFDGGLNGQTVNVTEELEGYDFTEEEKENLKIAYAEIADNKLKGFGEREEIELDFKDILTQLAEQGGAEIPPAYKPFLNMIKPIRVTVGGVVKSPLTFANDGEPSWKNPADTEIPTTINGINEIEFLLDNVLYMPYDFVPEVFKMKVLKTMDMYVSFADKSKFNAFDNGYKKFVEEQKAEFLETVELSADDVQFITLYDNYSFVSFKSYADKVMGIGLVLMVAFLFVTGLVVLSNMTRLMEEERQQVACLKTLGYSSFKIVFKYILFAALATGAGGAGAYFVGIGLAYLICYVFNYSFNMPPVSPQVALTFYLAVFFIIVAVALVSTLVAGIKLTRETPANLLRPKPPKAGKNVFLERIPIIWNLLSFKYKSTMRNVLRYLSRFLMTVVSVAVSMALVMAGLALLDVCIFGGINSPSVMGIAAVIIVFAGLLTAVVIYTLTNINISERNRELATLKVLGYHEREVAGYIYREVYIDTVTGILFGYLLALPLMKILFNILGTGAIASVTWFWWLTAPFVVLSFTFLVTLMLKPKIKKIDMNESLKAIE